MWIKNVGVMVSYISKTKLFSKFKHTLLTFAYSSVKLHIEIEMRWLDIVFLLNDLEMMSGMIIGKCAGCAILKR